VRQHGTPGPITVGKRLSSSSLLPGTIAKPILSPGSSVSTVSTPKSSVSTVSTPGFSVSTVSKSSVSKSGSTVFTPGSTVSTVSTPGSTPGSSQARPGPMPTLRLEPSPTLSPTLSPTPNPSSLEAKIIAAKGNLKAIPKNEEKSGLLEAIRKGFPLKKTEPEPKSKTETISNDLAKAVSDAINERRHLLNQNTDDNSDSGSDWGEDNNEAGSSTLTMTPSQNYVVFTLMDKSDRFKKTLYVLSMEDFNNFVNVTPVAPLVGGEDPYFNKYLKYKSKYMSLKKSFK
jgi:hypothetical protein